MSVEARVTDPTRFPLKGSGKPTTALKGVA